MVPWAELFVELEEGVVAEQVPLRVHVAEGGAKENGAGDEGLLPVVRSHGAETRALLGVLSILAVVLRQDSDCRQVADFSGRPPREPEPEKQFLTNLGAVKSKFRLALLPVTFCHRTWVNRAFRDPKTPGQSDSLPPFARIAHGQEPRRIPNHFTAV